ncbi:MAG: nucleotide pyrophosphohydrolase [Candidatus Verstraetearchaeota archaeon]|nr:nucleotide pyrophosphohydrolase [Candidatus Verstraetearchaeota archaeon]
MLKDIYYERDRIRGVEKTFMWFVEEVGELANAIKSRDHELMVSEFADVLAWFLSLANILNIDVENAFLSKYDHKCPRCGNSPCTCPMR